MSFQWKTIVRSKPLIGFVAIAALMTGAMASFTSAGSQQAYATPYQDLTAAQTSKANVEKKLSGVNAQLKSTILQLNDLVNKKIPAAEDASNAADDTATKAKQTAQEVGQRLAAAQTDEASLQAQIKKTGADYDDSKAAVAQAARDSFHSSASSKIMSLVTRSRSTDSFVENMQTNSAVARVAAAEANSAANTLSTATNRRERLKAIEQRIVALKQEADSSAAAAQAAAQEAQQKAESLTALQSQAEQKQQTLTSQQSQLKTQAAKEAVAVLQAQQAVNEYNRKLAAQRAAEQARAAKLAAEQYNAAMAGRRAAQAAAARRAASRASSSSSNSYNRSWGSSSGAGRGSGSSSAGRSSGTSSGGSASSPSHSENSAATAMGMNYSVPGNCSATATYCYGHPTGRSLGVLGSAYPWSQCTWWAYIRRTQLNLPVGSYLGNGGEWDTKAAALGYYVNTTPHVGAAVSFNPGQAGSSAIYGHVAVVERVNSNGTILISECGSRNHGRILTRILGNVNTYHYIHY